MQSDCHVTRAALKAIVISFYVCVQECLVIDASLLHSLDHRLSAEVSEKGIVKLDIPWHSVRLLALLDRRCNIRQPSS